MIVLYTTNDTKGLFLEKTFRAKKIPFRVVDDLETLFEKKEQLQNESITAPFVVNDVNKWYTYKECVQALKTDQKFFFGESAHVKK